MWKEKSINIGIVPQGVYQYIEFEYLGNEAITDITTSCGCSQAEYKDKKLTIRFHPAPVPTHLIRDGKDSYTSTKYVNLKEGNKHIQLSFTATIKSNLK